MFNHFARHEQAFADWRRDGYPGDVSLGDFASFQAQFAGDLFDFVSLHAQFTGPQ